MVQDERLSETHLYDEFIRSTSISETLRSFTPDFFTIHSSDFPISLEISFDVSTLGGR